MVKVILSRKAGLELREIYESILKISFSIEVATSKVELIKGSIRSLETFPEIGMRASEKFPSIDWGFGVNIRVFVSDKYLIFYDYLPDNDCVEVLHIVNYRRDLYRIFK